MSEKTHQESLIKRFGLKYDRRYPCVSNDTVNFTRVEMAGSLAQMYAVDYGSVNHAYLVCEGQVLNNGVTGIFHPVFRPNYSFNGLMAIGNDKTSLWLGYTLEDFYIDIINDQQFKPKPNKEFAMNRTHLEQVFPGEQLTEAVNRLRQAYLRLI